jgi:hypothetical protein
MAVELRCPGCRAKLRLPTAPEEGSEIECPKCGQVFSADAAAASPRGSDEEAPPRKKSADDAPEKPKKKKGGETPATAAPRRRKLKKRRSNPYVLYGAIGGGILLLCIIIAAIIWFFNRQSVSQKLMLYLPDDCDEVYGINLGHLQKYPEFYKVCENNFAATGFKRAADLFAWAIGMETNDAIAYVVQGNGRVGGSGQELAATVFYTKEPFDQERIGRLPGAQKGTRNGVDYYVIPDIPQLAYGGIKVFAPTDRIVVFTRSDTPDAKFDAMLTGHKDNKEATPGVRAGQLAKQVVRGTVWRFMLYGRSVNKPQPSAAATSAGSESDDELLKKEYTDILANAQGCGFKASVGSREVRGEFVAWYKDSEAANAMLKKYREKDWVQDEEKDPPKFMKAVASKSGGGKTALPAIRDALSFRQSGETFSVRTAMDVNLIQNGIGGLAAAFTNPAGGPGRMGLGGGPNVSGPPGGAPPGNPRRRRPHGVRRRPVRTIPL